MASRGTEQANNAFIALIVAVATIGGFMFGYDSGVINGTQDGLRAAFNLSDWWLGVAVAALLPGCAIGAFLAGRLADLFGRRAVMMSAALIFIGSALLAGAAHNAELFIAARFVAGLAVGAASVISPVYISEVTPAAIRGRLSSVQQVMIIAGLTGAFLVEQQGHSARAVGVESRPSESARGIVRAAPRGKLRAKTDPGPRGFQYPDLRTRAAVPRNRRALRRPRRLPADLAVAPLRQPLLPRDRKLVRQRLGLRHGDPRG